MSNFANVFAYLRQQRQPQAAPMQTGGVMPPQGMPMQTGGNAQQFPAMQTGGPGQRWGQPMGMQTGGALPPQAGGQSPMWGQPPSRLATLQQRFGQAPSWQPPGGFNYNRR